MAIINRNILASGQAVVAAALLAAPAVGVAQTAEQNGVRIGSGRLNPTISFDATYDSAAGVVGGEMKGGTILHVRPGFRFLAPSNSMEVKLDANYDYNAFLGDELSGLSKSAADADLGLLFNKDGDVQFEISDKFVRSDRTDVYSLDINSIVNRNDASLRLITRSGDSWSITPSYTLGVQFFESAIDDDAYADSLEYYDNLTHNARVDARFSLAPRTALLVDVGVGFRSYTGDESRLGRELADDVGNTRLQLGVTSMLSNKVGVTVMGGYGMQFGLDDTVDGESRGFSGLIGKAELGWYATELTTVRLGYGRTFQADPRHDYYSDDRIYLESALAFTRQFGVRAGISYDMVEFGTPVAAVGNVEVEDSSSDIFRFHVGPTWQFNRWFGAGLSYALTSRAGEGSYKDSPYYNYDRNEVTGRVTFTY